MGTGSMKDNISEGQSVWQHLSFWLLTFAAGRCRVMLISGDRTLDTHCAMLCQAQLPLVGNTANIHVVGTGRLLYQLSSHCMFLHQDTRCPCTHSSITPAFVALVPGHLTARAMAHRY
jgi:hypothetical protein